MKHNPYVKNTMDKQVILNKKLFYASSEIFIEASFINLSFPPLSF